MKFGIAAWIITMCFAVQPTFASTHKYAVLIGNNKGHDSSKNLRYAEKDARKMASTLVDLGGFDQDDVTVLVGKNAKTAFNALQNVERKIEQRSRLGEKTLLLFFYSGHADGDVLELGDSSFPFTKLQNILRYSRADVRIAFVDSCESGNLISIKGGHRGPEFDIQVSDEINSSGYAILTSSSQNELSQESRDIRGAVFTHYLVSALRGAGDESGDGRVTLAEAYRYTYTRTLIRTSRTSVGGQHPMYDFDLKGRGEIILTNTKNSGSSIVVTSNSAARLLVLDEKAQSIVAESDIEANKPALVAVRPGIYTAYLVSEDGAVREALTETRENSKSKLVASDFHTVELEKPIRKGGLFKEEAKRKTHRLSLGGLWRLFPLEGEIDSYGLSAVYRLEFPGGFEPLFRVTWATRRDVGLSTGYHDLGAQLGVGYLRSFKHFGLRAGILGGVDYIFQDDHGGSPRGTPAFSYIGLVGTIVPIGRIDLALDAGAGARLFELMDVGVVHRFDAQVVLTLGWRWIN